MFLGLSACSSVEKKAELKSSLEVQPPTAVTTAPTESASPNEASGLTADLLYDLLLSGFAFQAGELETASVALSRAARASGDVELNSRAARMALHSKQYAEAAKLGQDWIAQNPKDHLAFIITALAAILDDNSELSLDTLTALLAQDESLLGLRFQQIGEVFLKHADRPAAYLMLEELVSSHSQVPQAWMVLAGLAQRNKDTAKMLLALDKVLALDAENQSAAGYKLAALEANKTAQANFAQDYLLAHPQAHIFHMQYVRLLLRADEDKLALEQVLALLETDAENADAVNIAALLYQGEEDYKNAAMLFKRRLVLTPEDDRSRIYYASALQHLKRYDDAKIILAEIKDKTEVFDGQRQMALVIEQDEGIDGALAFLETVRGHDQAQNVQLIVDKELMLKRAERKQEALKVINEGLVLYDDDTLRYHRALMTVDMDDLKTHESDMRILLARKPENPHYHNTLGYSLLTMSDRLEEATEFINKAHALKPDDPYILDSKGWLEYKKGDFMAALKLLKQAYAIDQDAEIAAHIGEVHWVNGEQQKARDYWQKGDKIDAKNKSLIEIKARFLK